jgi:hypothetical protein
VPPCRHTGQRRLVTACPAWGSRGWPGGDRAPWAAERAISRAAKTTISKGGDHEIADQALEPGSGRFLDARGSTTGRFLTVASLMLGSLVALAPTDAHAITYTFDNSNGGVTAGVNFVGVFGGQMDGMKVTVFFSGGGQETKYWAVKFHCSPVVPSAQDGVLGSAGNPT